MEVGIRLCVAKLLPEEGVTFLGSGLEMKNAKTTSIAD